MSGFVLARFFIAAVLIATLPQPSGAQIESDEVYTVLKKGKEIGEKQKENDEKLRVMEKDQLQKQADNKELKAEEASWLSYALDFNKRCQRTFVTGEEGVFAACKAEGTNGQSKDAELKSNRKALDEWFSKFNALKQRRVELRSEEARWKSKIKVNAALNAILSNCAVSGRDLSELVYNYQVCFDGRSPNSGLSLTNPNIGTKITPNR